MCIREEATLETVNFRTFSCCYAHSPGQSEQDWEELPVKAEQFNGNYVLTYSVSRPVSHLHPFWAIRLMHGLSRQGMFFVRVLQAV